MSQVGRERRKLSPLRVVAGALLTGIVMFIVTVLANLFITASTFRRTLEHEQYLRIQRSINLLIVIRDELTRVKDRIEAGQLDVHLVGATIVPPQGEWPTQMWSSAAQWSTDIFSIDTNLLKLLASVYDQIYYAHRLLEIAQLTSNTTGAMVQSLIALEPSSEKQLPESLRRAFATPIIKWLRLYLESYKEVKSEISKRLPDVLVAIDLAITKLKEESRQ